MFITERPLHRELHRAHDLYFIQCIYNALKSKEYNNKKNNLKYLSLSFKAWQPLSWLNGKSNHGSDWFQNLLPRKYLNHYMMKKFVRK